MTGVFTSNPHGTNPYECPEKVRQMILGSKAIQQGWVSTSDLYSVTQNRVKRDLLHTVLKDMLKTRKLKMRIMKVPGARDRTEFCLIDEQTNHERAMA